MIEHRPKRINGKRVTSPEYRSWQMMKNRCDNPRGQDYAKYGGRGVTYDPRWKSFDNFLFDMGPRPRAKDTLERIDNNGPYTPSNCCWASRLAQARNRSITKQYKGKYTWEWAAELGLSLQGFHSRLEKHRRGKISEEAVFRGRK